MADDPDVLNDAARPHVWAMIEAMQGVGENPLGVAVAVPMGDESMWVLGGLLVDGKVRNDPESVFRVFCEAVAFMLEGMPETLGPLMPEVFERFVKAAGGTVETVHMEAPDELPDEDEESSLQRMARRRRG